MLSKVLNKRNSYIFFVFSFFLNTKKANIIKTNLEGKPRLSFLLHIGLCLTTTVHEINFPLALMVLHTVLTSLAKKYPGTHMCTSTSKETPFYAWAHYS